MWWLLPASSAIPRRGHWSEYWEWSVPSKHGPGVADQPIHKPWSWGGVVPAVSTKAVLTVGTLIVSPSVSEESESELEAVSMRTDSARLDTLSRRSV